MGIFKSFWNRLNRKDNLERLIIELNKIALLRERNSIGSAYLALGDEPESIHTSVFSDFEGKRMMIVADNTLWYKKLKLEAKVNGDWLLIAQYDSDKNNDIVWSGREDLNRLGKRFLAQYKILTENQIKQRKGAVI